MAGYTKAPSRVVVIEKRLLRSNAYRSLKKPTAYFVLGIFLTKRQMVKVGRSGKRQWVIANNGEIEFTYPEAERKYGISRSAFGKTVDELRDKGFIDIAESGAGLYK